MSPKMISETATNILLLCNNINDLIVKSNDRQNARDVLKAAVIYAKNNNFPLPKEKVDNFFDVLLDKKPGVLSLYIKDIASDILLADRAH